MKEEGIEWKISWTWRKGGKTRILIHLHWIITEN